MIEKDRHIDITDTELQNILDSYAEASLRALEECAPPDLEARLDATISGLASRSRRRRIWFRATAAAASVALLLTTGIGLMSRRDTLPATVTAESRPGSADSGSLLPEFPAIASATTSLEECTHPASDSDESSPTAPTPDGVYGLSSPKPTAAAKRIAASPAKRPGTSQVEKITQQLTSNGIAEHIAASVSAVTLAPQLTLSVTVPDNLPTSPAESTALASSREMSKMMESLDKVNAVFYEARKIASSLSEDVAYAVSSPLRSI